MLYVVILSVMEVWTTFQIRAPLKSEIYLALLLLANREGSRNRPRETLSPPDGLHLGRDSRRWVASESW